MELSEFNTALTQFNVMLQYQPGLLNKEPATEATGKRLAEMTISFVREYSAQRKKEIGQSSR